MSRSPISARDSEQSAAADLPRVRALRPALAAVECFERLTALPHCLFLDSAMRDPQMGRYSFVTADPIEWIEVAADQPDALSQLEQRLAALPYSPVAGLPPFQGGAAGLFSYELGRQWEAIPPPRRDPWALPALAIGIYDWVLAFDHVEGGAWIIAQGWPEAEPAARRARAEERLNQVASWLAEPPRAQPASATAGAGDALPQAAFGPQFATPAGELLTSNLSESAYLAMIARAIDWIHAGDIFQVNLAQSLLCPAQDTSPALYRRLRERNPAPLAGYFDLGACQVISASPERFLSVRGGRVEARPIKGTRRRTRLPEADLFGGDILQASPKDRAENVMIVDLMRNDLSRVCQAGSVCVEALCRLENYQFVQHLVSVVSGQLRGECTAIDLLRAAFPGGSISGAPKVRAMEIIAELEPTARGAYCGSLGYLTPAGTMDTSILIRTVTAGRGWWQLPVGGGIVAQSVPPQEYAETWHKAEGLLRALRP